jgi:hypothetical protein
MSIEPPDWYIQRCALRIIRGLDTALPGESESEPTNVFSLEAGRTRRATHEIFRRRGEQ